MPPDSAKSSIDRRAFLGSAATGLAFAATACSGEWLRERHYRMIDRQLNRYRGPLDGYGYLDRPAFSLDDSFRPPQIRYCPQAGDIMFSVTRSIVYTAGHKLAGASQPSHSGYVFRGTNGVPMIMEAGSFDVAVIRAIEATELLSAYDNRSRVWIRPRCVPLTPEQDCRLTEFSVKQEGKRFARLRLYAQVTPFRSRGSIKSEFIGEPHGPDRWTYFCAEMTSEAFVYAGLVPPENARPAATYPCDLFFDESKIPFLNRNFKLSCFGWGVPSRWRPFTIDCEAAR
jgi:hypothetical protein